MLPSRSSLVARLLMASTLATAACGCSGGQGTSATGNLQDQPSGNACGSALKSALQTRCWTDKAALIYGEDPHKGPIISFGETEGTIEDPLGIHEEFGSTCCGARASEATANQACVELCAEMLCEKAKAVHLKLAHEKATLGCSALDCGFNRTACLTGQNHSQVIKFDGVKTYTYSLKAECQGARTNEVFHGDYFSWSEVPIDDPVNNPPACREGS